MDSLLRIYPFETIISVILVVFAVKIYIRRIKRQRMIKRYEKCGLCIERYRRKNKKIKIKLQDGMSEEKIQNTLSSICEIEDLEINNVIKKGYKTYILEEIKVPQKANPQMGDITKIGIGQDKNKRDYFIKLYETGTIGVLMRSGHGKTSFALSLILQAINIFKRTQTKLIITIIDYKRGVDFTFLKTIKGKYENVEIKIIPSNEIDLILEHLESLNHIYERNLIKRESENVDFDYRLKGHKEHHITIFDEFERILTTKGVDDTELKKKLNRVNKLINDGSGVYRASSINLIMITQSAKTSELPIQVNNFNLLLLSHLSTQQASFYGIDSDFVKNNKSLGKGKIIYKEDGKEPEIIRTIHFGTNEELMKKKRL